MKPEEITSSAAETLSPEAQAERASELRALAEVKRLRLIQCAVNSKRQAAYVSAKASQIESIFNTVETAGEVSPEQHTLIDQLILEIIDHADTLLREDHSGFAGRNEELGGSRSEESERILQGANARIAELQKQLAEANGAAKAAEFSAEIAELRSDLVLAREATDAANAALAELRLRIPPADPIPLGDVVGGDPGAN